MKKFTIEQHKTADRKPPEGQCVLIPGASCPIVAYLDGDEFIVCNSPIRAIRRLANVQWWATLPREFSKE